VSTAVIRKMVMKTVTAHFVCRVDSPLNVIGSMKCKHKLLTAMFKSLKINTTEVSSQERGTEGKVQ
jgi:hypothetical protein